jgi:hypothetical protein
VRKFIIQRLADLLAPDHGRDDLAMRAVELGMREGLSGIEIVRLVDELERRTGRRLHRFPSKN